MPIFFQQQINETTRLGIWKIEEGEEYFKGNVPQHRDVTHPHKRLQHLAGRFLLQYLFPDFPYGLVEIADTRKPFLVDEKYHFSISHCGDYAAAIVSSRQKVGVDIEMLTDKAAKIQRKFISETELNLFPELLTPNSELPTLFWAAKESVFKWHGVAAVDFRKHIVIKAFDEKQQTIGVRFEKSASDLSIHFLKTTEFVAAWVVGEGG
jgi:phosphopantetheinyl transferase